jgi:hypothetical protein
MRTLPTTMIQTLAPFAPLFSKRVFEHAQVLVAGAILAPGKRTVGSALRAMGLEQEKRFHRYHRVLSRARWSGREASRVLLKMLVETFVPDGPLVLGIDETLERRRGAKIRAKGIYRDPVRSSHTHFVKTSGLRWVCVTLLAPIPWAGRVWALPFLCALAYSERYAREHGKRHKPLTEWAWQLLLLVRRCQPGREIVAVADRTYASLKLLDRCRRLRKPITFITRLRLDAALYEPAPPRRAGQKGRPRLKGERLPNLSEVAEDPATTWKTAKVPDLYGEGERAVEVSSATAVWPQHGVARRAPALGVDPRSARRVRHPSLAVHRPRRRSPADHLLVRQALANGGHFSGGASAIGVRDAAAVVGVSDTEERADALGPVLAGCAFRQPTDGEPVYGGSETSRMVRQASPDLLRRFGVGAQTAVGTGGDFLRVAPRGRHGESTTGFDGAPNRRGLLRSLTAKVELEKLSEK